ncbi:hypothetical protein KAV47_05895, partial [Candidatus Bathyarchaeota archaeon]|nr:hypothetical protein [Candidatus Bathyarchaeota archaeon]
TVHAARKALGHALVELHGLRDEYGITEGTPDDLVLIPVPDSGRSVCTGVAEGLGVTADEGVIKNAYMGRTYIIDNPEYRKLASDLKHNIIRETVDGKKVIITDDSIVRGTVSESVAQNLVKAGAREVEFLVSYAPIFYPCFSDPRDKPLAARPLHGEEPRGDRGPSLAGSAQHQQGAVQRRGAYTGGGGAAQGAHLHLLHKRPQPVQAVNCAAHPYSNS